MYRKIKAFTLVEIIISMFLISIILIIISDMFEMNLNMYTNASSEAELKSGNVIIIDFLEDVLLNAENITIWDKFPDDLNFDESKYYIFQYVNKIYYKMPNEEPELIIKDNINRTIEFVANGMLLSVNVTSKNNVDEFNSSKEIWIKKNGGEYIKDETIDELGTCLTFTFN